MEGVKISSWFSLSSSPLLPPFLIPSPSLSSTLEPFKGEVYLCGIYRRLPGLTVRTRVINSCCPTGTQGESLLASQKPWSAVPLNRL